MHLHVCDTRAVGAFAVWKVCLHADVSTESVLALRDFGSGEIYIADTAADTWIHPESIIWPLVICVCHGVLALVVLFIQ